MSHTFRAVLTCTIFLSILLVGDSAWACGCNSMLGFNEAELVFTGKIIGIKEVNDIEVTFKVYNVEKGELKSKEAIVHIPCFDDGCCGINMKKGQYYKVFTYTKNGEQHTNLCCATRQVTKIDRKKSHK